MIKSFRDKDTERIWNREPSKRLSAELQRTTLRKLVAIDGAEALQDLRIPPGNRLEKLSASRHGQMSMRVNDQWRICFIWKDGDAHEVEIVDYH
ncbi:MAG: type II toxin-antitoxin system RelE/ParE family toxin [Nitrospira sp.]|nr:type II toxin-antitoxin system RelE/ParE family toxin [Nitrospira sp.]